MPQGRKHCNSWGKYRRVKIREISVRSVEDAKKVMQKIGVDKIGINVMSPKTLQKFIYMKDMTLTQCHIIKQVALSNNTDAAVHKQVVTGRVEKSDILLFGTVKQLGYIAKSLSNQQFKLKEVANKINRIIDARKNRIWKFRGKEIDLTKKTAIMGILNVTPDSFSDGGKWTNIDNALKHCENMISQGADIVDVGGESTKPGARKVELAEELDRVIPVIEKIKQNFDIPVSIDTYKSKVAEEAAKAGVEIVNDISGLNFDDKMPDVIAKNKMGCCIMHILGTPENMQKNPHYEDVIDEINDYFGAAVKKAMEKGINSNAIVIDPGIGFGKRVIDNLTILNRLNEFNIHGLPVLIGLSRKSFIEKILNSEVDERLFSTIGAQVVAFMRGADIVRVHDVKAAFDSLRIAEAITKEVDGQ